MPESQLNNKRIAKNTVLLYFRMLFMMAVQLYTSRVVLNTLGIEDYGIYNVVGGIVAMFGFLNAAMTTSTQRYITFELGRKNLERLKLVFTTSVNIHILISIIVVLLAETVGLWFLYEKMVIPAERFTAAMWVFQLSIVTTVITIMSYPYNAAIVAHEKMSVFAYISILEVVSKLLIVYMLTIWNHDKLIFYAILYATIQLLVRFCYSEYCTRHFEETKYHWIIDKQLFKEMVVFAGWNLWGNLAAILFSQGLNMLLNVFFGPAVNAARAISVQVQGAIAQFSNNFQMAVNPQITKTYASGEFEEMYKLIHRGGKFSFFLLYILCLPVIIEAPLILEIWLKVVPDYTVIFLRLMIITMMIDSTANSFMIAASATGNVKVYQSVVGGILLAILPISYVALRLGGAPWSVFLVHLIVTCIAYFARLFIVGRLIKLDILHFLKDVVVRCILISIIAAIVPIAIHYTFDSSYILVLSNIIICVIVSSMSCYFLGLDKVEKSFVNSKIKGVLKKITK